MWCQLSLFLMSASALVSGQILIECEDNTGFFVENNTLRRNGTCDNIDVLLNFSFQEITAIDEEVFQGLDEVERITLTSNSLNGFTNNTFANLPALTRLDLDLNSLTTVVGGSFDTLSNLLHLRLGTNMISVLDQNFELLTSLTLLQMSINSLTALPENLQPSLRNILASNNFIAEIDLDLPQLTSLSLNSNPLRNVTFNLPALDSASLNRIGFPFPNVTFNIAGGLQSLDVSRTNNFFMPLTLNLSDVPVLLDADFRSMNLTGFPLGSFANNPLLGDIDVTSNPLDCCELQGLTELLRIPNRVDLTIENGRCVGPRGRISFSQPVRFFSLNGCLCPEDTIFSPDIDGCLPCQNEIFNCIVANLTSCLNPTCVVCEDGFFPIDSECRECQSPPDCLDINFNSTCSTEVPFFACNECDAAFFLEEELVCSACIQGQVGACRTYDTSTCASNSTSLVCLECEENFNLDESSGLCLVDDSGTSTTTIIIIVSSVGGALIILSVIASYIGWNKITKKKEKKMFNGLTPKEFLQEGQSTIHLQSDEEYETMRSHRISEHSFGTDGYSTPAPNFDTAASIIPRAPITPTDEYSEYDSYHEDEYSDVYRTIE